MMAERMRLKTSCDDSKSAEVETGRYATPHEIKRLLNPNSERVSFGEIEEIREKNWDD
jgi:hypothetical protein